MQGVSTLSCGHIHTYIYISIYTYIHACILLHRAVHTYAYESSITHKSMQTAEDTNTSTQPNDGNAGHDNNTASAVGFKSFDQRLSWLPGMHAQNVERQSAPLPTSASCVVVCAFLRCFSSCPSTNYWPELPSQHTTAAMPVRGCSGDHRRRSPCIHPVVTGRICNIVNRVM